MLWVDKYRPTNLRDMSYHEKLSTRLERLAAGGDFPHLLFYGPSGAGKKTRVMALLKSIYGNGVNKLKLDMRTFKVGSSGSKNIDLAIVSSNYHIEVNPSDAGIYDRFIIQELIKEVAQTQTMALDMGGSTSTAADAAEADGDEDDDLADINPAKGKGRASAAPAFKVVVLSDVDKLTREAQNALRRTMEKYMKTCRLVLVCNSTCKVIEPLQSRCLGIRVAAPSLAQIADILNHVCRREMLTLPEEMATKIAKASKRNLRRAILMLEATKVAQYPFSAEQMVERADWEYFLDDVVAAMVKEQSPRQLLNVRTMVYELLTHCIPAEIIIRRMAESVLQKVDTELKLQIIYWAAFYEHRIHRGSKPIFHIEAFVARFMSMYKAFLNNLADF